MQRPVAIDARAAVRPELGGVERWARELAARLPRLRPGGYAVVRPPRALVAPGRARVGAAAAAGGDGARAGAAVPCEPRARRRAQRRRRAARRRRPAPPGLVLAHLRRLAARAAAASWPGAPAGSSPCRSSRAPSSPSCSASTPRVVPGGVAEASTPDADPEPARRALRLARPVRAVRRRRTARARTSARSRAAARALAADGVHVVVAGGHRPQFAAEAGLAPLRLLGRGRRPPAARSLRRRRGVRAAVALRGLRPAGARGDGQRDARGRDRRRRAARDLRRSGAARRARRRRRFADGAARPARRRRGARATARRRTRAGARVHMGARRRATSTPSSPRCGLDCEWMPPAVP